MLLLNNGPWSFVVAGPPRALHRLVVNLRKVRGASGANQNEIFSIHFLVVGVHFHSVHFDKATEVLLEEDMNGEELWKPEEWRISVFNIEDGMFCVL